MTPLACDACAESLPPDAEQCPHCGERLEREEVPTDGYGRDSVVVAAVCVVVAILGIVVLL